MLSQFAAMRRSISCAGLLRLELVRLDASFFQQRRSPQSRFWSKPRHCATGHGTGATCNDNANGNGSGQ